MGIDQHENGAIAVSRVLREAQMKVVYGGLFNTPETIIEKALAADADVIGISCHSWEFEHYLPLLVARLKAMERQIPVVVGGSVLTPEDKKRLRALGVAASFSAGATPDEIVDAIRELAARNERKAQ
jgi:methylmalonyl-CoA mutase C-terminal domain/subunit